MQEKLYVDTYFIAVFEVVTNMLRTSSPLTFYIIMPHTHMQKLAVFTGPAEAKLNWSG